MLQPRPFDWPPQPSLEANPFDDARPSSSAAAAPPQRADTLRVCLPRWDERTSSYVEDCADADSRNGAFGRDLEPPFLPPTSLECAERGRHIGLVWPLANASLVGGRNASVRWRSCKVERLRLKICLGKPPKYGTCTELMPCDANRYEEWPLLPRTRKPTPAKLVATSCDGPPEVDDSVALTLLPGTQSQSDLIAGIDNGFLVQGVSGLHSGVNPVSGDFSTGAEGLRIRDGELAEPIREVTIASTVQRLLQEVTGIGDDLQWLPMSSAGVSLVVGDVTMSGA